MEIFLLCVVSVILTLLLFQIAAGNTCKNATFLTFQLAKRYGARKSSALRISVLLKGKIYDIFKILEMENASIF